MSSRKGLSAVDLERLREFDACTVSNAIEKFSVRLRNEGFISRAMRCRFPDLPPMVGYAATGRIRTASPPMTHRCYYDRMDWWTYVASLPKPRVIVVQDADGKPGLGAFVGEIHASIALALDCVGCVTNGAVRDLPAIKALNFQLFSGNLSVSHSYAHIIDPFGLADDAGLGEKPAPHYDGSEQLTPAERNALDVLELSWPLTRAAVKSRYKELVKLHHPDANGGARDAEEKLKQINAAYSTLRASEHLPTE